MRASLGSTSKLLHAAVLVVLLLGVVAFAAAACGIGDDVGDGGTVSTTTTLAPDSTTTVPSDTTTTSPSDTTSTTISGDESTMIKVYFSRNEKVCAATRVVPRTQQVGAAAMRALLEGPTTDEKQAGMVSSVPEGTTFLGLNVENGVATVDLSKEYESGGGSMSMFMRLAEVVFTLTQFPTVEGVNFKLDGQPIEVLGGEGILLESPTLGQTVTNPLRLAGTANVFEAVFRIEIVDADGLIVANQVVNATSGTGTRGTFDVTMGFTPQKTGLGSIIVSYDSPKDGSKVVVDEIPVMMK
jgi:hypothetical protein